MEKSFANEEKGHIRTKTNARQWFDRSKANQFPVIVTNERKTP